MKAAKTAPHKTNNKRIKAGGGKLTKGLLFAAHEGQCLISNQWDTSFKPLFFETISPLATRNEQWERVVSAGVDQKKCMTFDCREDANDFLTSYFDPTSEPIDPVSGVRLHIEKLSKRLLLTLPEGVLMVSCSFSSAANKPHFLLETASMSERETQWKNIIRAGFSRKRIFIFRNQNDMRDFFGTHKLTAAFVS